MSQTKMNCQAGSIALKIMFYRDTQALVIHISRGDVRSRRYMNRQRIWLVTLHRFSFFDLNATLFLAILSKFDVLVM